MSGKFIIDANVIIDYLRGKNNFLFELIEKEKVSVPIIVIGELFFGAENSKQISKHLHQIEELISEIEIIGIDLETTKKYGKIRAKLKKEGKPIPENDIWIAAIAMQNKLTLVTNDKHFENVENLKIRKS